jgi:hypothetical protein
MRFTTLVFAVLSLTIAASTAAAMSTVDFSEVPLFSSDPLINGVQFFAGDPAVLDDTYTDDFWSPGDPYLASGFDDGTGSSPALYDTFIGAHLTSGLFDTVSLDVLSEFFLPPGTTLWLVGLRGGAEVASVSLDVTDNSYHTMNLALGAVGGADTLFLYDDLDAFAFGEPFHIDDFVFNTADGNGGPAIPEPGTLVLFGLGLAAAGLLLRKQVVAAA